MSEAATRTTLSGLSPTKACAQPIGCPVHKAYPHRITYKLGIQTELTAYADLALLTYQK
jgi:hypothetical protein